MALGITRDQMAVRLAANCIWMQTLL